MNLGTLAFLLALSLVSCATQQSTKRDKTKPDLILLDAKVENNVPGYIRGTKTTEYYFKLIINTKRQIRFDSLWTDSSRHSVFIANTSGPISNNPVTPKYRDTIIVRASANAEKITTASPVDYDGKALIRYQVNQHQKYFTIKEIKVQNGPLRQ